MRMFENVTYSWSKPLAIFRIFIAMFHTHVLSGNMNEKKVITRFTFLLSFYQKFVYLCVDICVITGHSCCCRKHKELLKKTQKNSKNSSLFDRFPFCTHLLSFFSFFQLLGRTETTSKIKLTTVDCVWKNVCEKFLWLLFLSRFNFFSWVKKVIKWWRNVYMYIPGVKAPLVIIEIRF